MVLFQQKKSLLLKNAPIPSIEPGKILLKNHACGVCRTDLHIINGELSSPKLPLILGHQIVGTVVEIGENVPFSFKNKRVGVPWLGYTCSHCPFCLSGRENLCDYAQFTGYHIDGGFAEYTLADYRYAFPIPESFSDINAAPLLCAGLIGYRAYRMAPKAKNLGIYGFGSAAHIITQLAVKEGWNVYAFTREGDKEGQNFAKHLGAFWSGGSDTPPPELLDAAIIFAPVGSLVPLALKNVLKGGSVICAGIHMSDIPSFSYELLWEEKILRSVANLTRKDAHEFLSLAPRIPIKTEVVEFPLEQANEALSALSEGKVKGSVVLKINA